MNAQANTNSRVGFDVYFANLQASAAKRTAACKREINDLEQKRDDNSSYPSAHTARKAYGAKKAIRRFGENRGRFKVSGIRMTILHGFLSWVIFTPLDRGFVVGLYAWTLGFVIVLVSLWWARMFLYVFVWTRLNMKVWLCYAQTVEDNRMGFYPIHREFDNSYYDWDQLQGCYNPGDIVLVIVRRKAESNYCIVYAKGSNKVCYRGYKLGNPELVRDPGSSTDKEFMKLTTQVSLVKDIDSQIDRKTASLKYYQWQTKMYNASAGWESLTLYFPENIVFDLCHEALTCFVEQLGTSHLTCISGPAGSGKNYLVDSIAKQVSATVLMANSTTVKSFADFGALWEQAKAGATIIHIDDCPFIFDPSFCNLDAALRLLTTSTSRLWIVMSTRDRAQIPVEIRDHCTSQVVLPPLWKYLSAPVTFLQRTWKLAPKDGFANLGPLLEDCRADYYFMQRLISVFPKFVAVPGQVSFAELELSARTLMDRTTTTKSADAAKADWSKLILPPRTLKEIKLTCEMIQHAEALAKQGVSLPPGILLEGPPGTGKTEIARTIAGAGMNMVVVSTADLKQNYVGQSGQAVAKIFAEARKKAPCIIFIDEIDIVAPKRGGIRSEDVMTREIVGQLLQEMDGAKKTTGHILVIGATNDIDGIDTAILSRLPTVIRVDLPDEANRRDMIRLRLREKPHQLSDAALTEIVAQTEGWSGRDIKFLVETAEREAVARAIASGNISSITITEEDLLSVTSNPHAAKSR